MNFDVVTIGSAVRDIFVETDRFRVIETGDFEEGKAECLPAGAKIEVDEMVFTTGGGATNAAVTFVRQGYSVASLIRLGKDLAAEEILSQLEGEGIEMNLTQKDDGRHTGHSILLLSSDGERTVLVTRGASSAIDPDEVPWDEMHAHWFHITSLGGNFDLLERAVAEAERKKIEVFLNPGSQELSDKKRLLEVLKKVDVLNVNLEEAARLTGIDREKKEDVFESLFGATRGIVVVTDGANGTEVYDGEHIHHGGTFQENEVADRTGAGDAFGSGFVVGLMRFSSAKEGIRIGAANATSVIESIGARAGILHVEDLKYNRWGGLEITEKDIT